MATLKKNKLVVQVKPRGGGGDGGEGGGAGAGREWKLADRFAQLADDFDMLGMSGAAAAAAAARQLEAAATGVGGAGVGAIAPGLFEGLRCSRPSLAQNLALLGAAVGAGVTLAPATPQQSAALPEVPPARCCTPLQRNAFQILVY